jgi:hypothetical protein
MLHYLGGRRQAMGDSDSPCFCAATAYRLSPTACIWQILTGCYADGPEKILISLSAIIM